MRKKLFLWKVLNFKCPKERGVDIYCSNLSRIVCMYTGVASPEKKERMCLRAHDRSENFYDFRN
jgi:hypothetical protein